jgi:hypothetical protein
VDRQEDVMGWRVRQVTRCIVHFGKVESGATWHDSNVAHGQTGRSGLRLKNQSISRNQVSVVP